MAGILTYFDQLNYLAQLGKVDLQSAFKRADMPKSTFYRARKGIDMRASTAVRVAQEIEAMGRNES